MEKIQWLGFDLFCKAGGTSSFLEDIISYALLFLL